MTDAVRPTSPPLQGEAALVRALGPFQLGASIVNIIVGAGIFVMPALLAARLGAAAPLAFVAGALAIVPTALCFAAVGSRATATGGPYTYVGAGFGPFAGFLAGALMWICNVASSAGVAAALAGQAAQAWPAFAQGAPRAALIVAAYAALFALNAFGVRLGARAIVLLATLKLTPLFLLAGLGLWLVGADLGFDARALPSWGAFGSALVLTVFAYSGMETALVPSGEVRDPSRHVPRATLAAIALVVLLYVALQAVAQGALGPALAGSRAPLADAAGALWSPARAALLAAAGVSMLGFLMGNLFSSSRLLFALGRDGYLPRAFGRVDPRHRVPRLGLFAHAAIAAALAVAGSFEALALISGGAICLVFAAVALAAWRAQALDLRGPGAPLILPGGATVPALAVLTMGAILTTLSAKEWAAIATSLAALVLVYAVLSVLRGRTARGQARRA
ncbi:APC family permease [Vulcaniibacterium tengchongense]|uniref:Arginine/agmatine antiporter n=2 Tax=Vulcaniibacterium tengchongense TaxID=1273429 RepID=A0A3N4VJV1_9GAMM|nr:APC family permease [Vulcaniibacterium tengchongense]RPE80009.1 APA family basic amino acid/polyamine antiporter [Vulcaniibacterium tengchongense]